MSSHPALKFVSIHEVVKKAFLYSKIPQQRLERMKFLSCTEARGRFFQLPNW